MANNVLNINIDELLQDQETPINSANIDLGSGIVNCDDILKPEAKLNDILSQRKLMNDVIIMIGEISNLINSFLTRTNYNAEFYFNDFDFNFNNKEIKISMTFKSDDFDVFSFMNMIIDGYDKQFGDYVFNFIIDDGK